MYKIIQATKKHSKHILHHTTTTCYWKEFIEDNILGTDYDAMMLEWIIYPRLPYTYVLVENEDETKVHGCIIAMTNEQLAVMPDYTPYIHPRAIKVFGPWLNYQISDGVMVELFALDKNVRQGLDLYGIAENLAQKEKNGCMSQFIWAFNSDALQVAIKKGFMVTDCIYFMDPIKHPLLYLEKRPELTAMKNYFETPEYTNTKNMLAHIVV